MDNNEKATKCPLFSIVDAIAGCDEDCFCMEDACAWWIEDKQKCAVAVIGAKK